MEALDPEILHRYRQLGIVANQGTRLIRKNMIATLMAFLVLTVACGDSPSSTTTTPTVGSPDRSTTEPSGSAPSTAPSTAPTATPTTAAAAAPIPVTVAVGFRTPGVEHAVITSIPVAMGYWEEEGLDVDLQLVESSNVALEGIAAGQMDVTLSAGTSSVLAAKAAGLDIVGFSSVANQPFFHVYRLPSRPDLAGVDDLEGTKVGVPSLGSAQTVGLRAALAAAGVDPDSVEYVVAGVGAEANALLDRGDIDAITAATGAGAALQNQLGAVRVESPFLDSLSGSLMEVTSPGFLERQPEVATGLARGLAKAAAFAHANPEHAVQIHWEAYPQSRPAEGTEEEAMASALDQLAARLELMESDPETGWFLYVSDEDVSRYIDAMVAGGILEAPIQVEEVWDPRVIEEANNFDRSALEA